MSGELVRVTIDGKEVNVPAGTLIVEAGAKAGKEIPVFCYHPKLDPVGVCRMCLVEVEGIPKPVPACTTTVQDGMVVRTETERVETIQRGVLEFLLINHPLDCPVCDKGGECPLQDNTMRFGPATSRLFDGKMRKRKAVDLGRFIVLDEERCILCRRCVRFDDEISREGNLIVGHRGHDLVVTTSTGDQFDSYFSGNTIELCPVGALTSDPYRFKARPWDLSSVPSVCTGCSLGCNVRLDFRFGELVRVMSRDNPELDGGWLCDRGRFNYTYVNPDDPQRLNQPLVRGADGRLEPASWTEALQVIGSNLRRIRAEAGGAAIGLVGGGRLTNEAAYLFQKLGRAILETPHVDYRSGSQLAVSVADYPARVTDVDDADLVFIVDVLPQERIPVLDLRIRRALSRRGTKVTAIGAALPFYRDGARGIAVEPGATAAALAALTERLSGAGAPGDGASHEGALGDGAASDDGTRSSATAWQTVAAELTEARKVVVVWGGADEGVGQALLELLDRLAEMPHGEGPRSIHLLIPGEQANSRGAEFMGVRPDVLPGYRPITDEKARELFEKAWRVTLPGEPGWNTGQMLEAAAAGSLQGLIVAGANPALTYPRGELARKALKTVPFLVVVDLFMTETASYADVVLPAAPFPAVEGTYTAVDGLVQETELAMRAPGESRPDVDVFRAIAGAVGERPLIASSQEYQWELQQLVAGLLKEGRIPEAPRTLLANDPVGRPEVSQAEGAGDGGLRLVPVERLFAGGGTAYHDREIAAARPKAEGAVHPGDAARLQLQDGDSVALEAGGQSLFLTLKVRDDVPEGTVQVPTGLPEASVNRLTDDGLHPAVTVRRLALEEAG